MSFWNNIWVKQTGSFWNAISFLPQTPFFHKLSSPTSSFLRQSPFSCKVLSPTSSFFLQASFSHKLLSPTSFFFLQAPFSPSLFSHKLLSPTVSFLLQAPFFPNLLFPTSSFLPPNLLCPKPLYNWVLSERLLYL